jgi:amidase
MERATNGDRDGDGQVSRRRFLRYTSTVGALAAGGSAVAAMAGSGAAVAEPVAAVAGAAAGGIPAFKWEEATIAELQAAMQAGTLTSRHLVQAYIQRIRLIDLSGVQLNSVIEVNPDALAIADQLDRERRQNAVRGPLHGIPILVKDNFATDDQMETAAGSLALLGSRVPRDAFVVKGLRDAGAVILGKANLSEWANFRSIQSSSGWCGRAGQCLNPYVLDHNPCGSSSGSGAAVSANLAAATLGTETDGSIVCPASTNGVVGIKPTLGLTSRAGVVPIAHSQDVTGPICRTVADAATVLGAMTGVDARDPATAASQGHFFKDYRQFLDPNGLRGARIGVWREGVFGVSPEGDAIAEAAIGELSRLDATIVDPADIPNVTDVFDPEFTVLLFEFKADIAAYLSELSNTSMRTLADLIAFNDAHADQELRWFGQELFLLAEQTDGLDDPAYLTALQTSKRLMQGAIDATMDKFDLDAIVSLTGSPSWTTDLVNGDHFLTASSTPAAVAGYPNLTVPAGFSFGELPVGINFIGRQWAEPTLIKLAYGFEQGTKARHAPRFLASLAVRDFIPRDTGLPGASTGVRGAPDGARAGSTGRGRSQAGAKAKARPARGNPVAGGL